MKQEILEGISTLHHSSTHLMTIPTNSQLGDLLCLLWRSKISSDSSTRCAEHRNTSELPSPVLGTWGKAGSSVITPPWVCDLHFPSQQQGRASVLRDLDLLLEGLTEWERYKEDFDFCKLGLGLLKLHPWSAGFEALKPQQEISCIRNFPLPHMHLSSKHLMQGSCGIFPSALFKCILGFSISLFY